MEFLFESALDYLTRLFVIVVVALLLPIIRKYSLDWWAKKAVYAAEILYKEKGQGALKYEYVVEFLRKKFRWFTFSDKELKIVIEAAVEELHLQLVRQKVIE